MTRVYIIIFATLAQGVWLFLIIGQYGFFPIALGFFAVVGLVGFVIRQYYFVDRLWSRIGLGAIFGYIASCFGAFIAEFLLRGQEVFLRPYPIQNFYWFPLISMGWMFGIVVALAWSFKSSKPKS